MIKSKETFIRYYDNVLSPSFCKKVIDKFEQDPNKYQGKVLSVEGHDIKDDIKQTSELNISGPPEWQEIDSILSKSASECLIKYMKEFEDCTSVLVKASLIDQPYRIKKYEKDQYFTWHIDSVCPSSMQRVLAGQWYFNTVKKGGETEFKYQNTSIKCVEGRFALFPVSWTYLHRGAPAKSGVKYVCTTFFKPKFKEY